MNYGCESDLIYDIGMHKGEDTAFYLKKGFRVVGFEADPDLAAHCRRVFAKEIEHGLVRIVEGAIIEQDSARPIPMIQFYKNDENTVWGTVFSSWSTRNQSLGTQSKVIDVPTVDFAECLRELGVPYFMKIDIEGMDTVCLKGLAKVDGRPKYVSIESNKTNYASVLEELELLTSLGYSQFKAVQQQVVKDQVEPSPSREGKFAGWRFQFGASGLFGADLPGRWVSRDQIASYYKRTFVLYALFGDYGVLNDYLLGRLLKKALRVILRRPIPGWYDTHAKHSSVATEQQNRHRAAVA